MKSSASTSLSDDLESGTHFLVEETDDSGVVDRILKRLQKDDHILFDKYRKISKRKASKVLQPLLWYTDTFGISVDTHEQTFSEALRSFSRTISLSREAGVQLCAIIANSDFLDLKPSLGEAPKEMIAEVLLETWNVDRTELSELIATNEPGLPKWEVQLPSERKVTSYSIIDPGRISFKLEWPPRDAPLYVNDLHNYVWQPFARLPGLKSARIHLLRGQPRTEDFRAIVTFGTSQTIPKFQELYEKQPRDFQDVHNASRWQVDLLTLLYNEIKSDTLEFLKTSSLSIDQLTFHGRVRPSGGKMQYLLHLSDWQRTAFDACKQNVYILTQILASCSVIPHETSGTLLQRWIEPLMSVKEDLEVLQREFDQIQTRIASLSQTLNEQLQLAQMRRSYLLTVLVGLYVPMSFLASYFGMNITQNSKSTTWQSVNISTPNLEAASAQLNKSIKVNSTSGVFIMPQNITTTSSPTGNQSWSISTFWALSIPLSICTILFPLLAGEFLRKCLKAYDKRPKPLRVLLVLYACCCIALPLTPWNDMLSIYDSEQSDGITAPWPAACILILTFQCLGLIPIYLQAYAALRKDPKRQRVFIFWSFLGTFMLISYLLPFLIVTYVTDSEGDPLSYEAYVQATDKPSLDVSELAKIDKLARLLWVPWSFISWAMFFAAWLICPDYFTSWDDYTSLNDYKGRG